MINKIKTIFKDKDKKVLLENFLSLSVLQGANYILPLITLPYLVRVLGPEKFGLLAFAQAFVAYFGILMDYGFSFSGTREVSVHRENKDKLNEIYSSIVTLKFIIFIFSFLILSVIIFSFNKFKEDYIVYYFTFLGFLGGIFFQSWLFQGLEKMKFITFVNLFTKILFTVSIFIFIHQMSDYIYVPLISSIGSIIGGLISLYITFKYLRIKYNLPKLKSLIFYVKDSTPLFFSQASISLFNQVNTFLGGLIFNYTLLGYYTLAEKLFIALRNLYNILFQVLYPYFSKRKFNLQEKYVKIILIFCFLLFVILFLSAKFLINLLYGDEYKISIEMLRIFSIILFFSGINTLIFVLWVLTKRLYKDYFWINFSGGILNISLILILSNFFGIFGIPISILIVEVFFILSYIRKYRYYFRKNINKNCIQ